MRARSTLGLAAAANADIKALIVLNKPAGHECSQKPKHHPSIYSLLPAPLRRRDVQAVGRLELVLVMRVQNSGSWISGVA